jgi:hypothetical protein
MLTDKMNKAGRRIVWFVGGLVIFAAWCGLMYFGLWGLVGALRLVGVDI